MKRSALVFEALALFLGSLGQASAQQNDARHIAPDGPGTSSCILPLPGGKFHFGSDGGGGINLAQAIVVSFAPPGTPSTFTDKTFSIGFTLKDDPSGQTANFTATGLGNGGKRPDSVKWEYKVVAPDTPLDAKLPAQLNKLGEEGWKYCSSLGGGILLFKRPK